MAEAKRALVKMRRHKTFTKRTHGRGKSVARRAVTHSRRGYK